MARNIGLLQQLSDHITMHPDEHDQKTWGTRTPCGTTLCAAGRAAVLAGWELHYDADIIFNGDREYLSRCRHPATGESLHPKWAATKELGLTRSEARQLFIECATRDAVLDYLDKLIECEDD